jgi:hypothetical protein
VKCNSSHNRKPAELQGHGALVPYPNSDLPSVEIPTHQYLTKLPRGANVESQRQRNKTEGHKTIMLASQKAIITLKHHTQQGLPLE